MSAKVNKMHVIRVNLFRFIILKILFYLNFLIMLILNQLVTLSNVRESFIKLLVFQIFDKTFFKINIVSEGV